MGNRPKHLPALLLVLLLTLGLRAQTTDSVDVLDYDVSLELGSGKPFGGDATLTVRLAAPCQSLALSLYGTADSIWVDGMHAAGATLDAIPLGAHAAGDTLTVRVRYSGSGFVESYGWGGFHFDNNMSYNLGVGFSVDPHNMGAAMMPCRDNFHDKATYTLRVHTAKGWTAECGGMLVSRTPQDDGSERSVWRIDQPTSTYLVSVSQAAWRRIEGSVQSLHGTYPLTLGFTYQDSAHVGSTFAELDSVVPMFERCLGPYRWGRIGYIATAKGSMEHVNNIALAREFMATVTERGQMTIAHELGHAWFGNLVTCATEGDMWFNEGGASFCSELAMEATKGREASNRYYQTNLENVLRTTHLNDGGYRPLSPMPHGSTYGSTTYDKGALVWHSLRGYLGDSLFYASMRQLMATKAFGTVNADEVRDSLALYSGVDLADFFQFHVFSPGFVDFYVSLDGEQGGAGDGWTLCVRQQGVGTDAVVHSGRLPVTFFSAAGDTAKRMLAIEGSESHPTVQLPFPPAWYVMDYDLQLSDAATLAVFDSSTSSQAKHAHFRLGATLKGGDRLAVEHHWGQPWGADSMDGVVRTAQRYWLVRGPKGQYDGTKGMFHFVREGYEGGSYSHLDRGFYALTASIDSMVVLYRSGHNAPWRAVSHQRNGNADEGYFIVDNLCPGEYTLAVADMEALDVSSADGSPAPTLFPNPVRSGQPLTLDVPVDGTFGVRILDSAGRQVWHRKGCRSGDSIHPRLPQGTYLVQIENKVVSLQSKLIVL